ncbi:amidohydrolase family protein [Kineococcus sp. SYSU DK004]|uniref:amidohydrolase family protein n=1 Tax=Kineococcus sp. SYSU DK004 TaxID=3383125 RepID=UPI003D7E7E21
MSAAPPEDPVVDAHHHLWDPARRRYPWMEVPGREPLRRPFDLDDLRAATSAAGVERTVLVQTVSAHEETREFLRVADGSDGLVAAVVGWVDLAGDVPARVAELRRAPGGALLAGVRHQAEDEPGTAWLERPEVLRGAVAAARAGLVHDLLVRADQLDAASALVDAVDAAAPGASFVLDHGAKPPVGGDGWAAWAAAVTRLAQRPQVRCKLSGLFTLVPAGTSDDVLRPTVEHLLAVFGPGRLLFGTDWPVSTLAAGYADVVTRTRALLAGLAPGERAAVLGGGAATVYGLAAPAPTPT